MAGVRAPFLSRCPGFSVRAAIHPDSLFSSLLLRTDAMDASDLSLLGSPSVENDLPSQIGRKYTPIRRSFQEGYSVGRTLTSERTYGRLATG